MSYLVICNVENESQQVEGPSDHQSFLDLSNLDFMWMAIHLSQIELVHHPVHEGSLPSTLQRENKGKLTRFIRY